MTDNITLAGLASRSPEVSAAVQRVLDDIDAEDARHHIRVRSAILQVRIIMESVPQLPDGFVDQDHDGHG